MFSGSRLDLYAASCAINYDHMSCHFDSVKGLSNELAQISEVSP